MLLCMWEVSSRDWEGGLDKLQVSTGQLPDLLPSVRPDIRGHACDKGGVCVNRERDSGGHGLGYGI